MRQLGTGRAEPATPTQFQPMAAAAARDAAPATSFHRNTGSLAASTSALQPALASVGDREQDRHRGLSRQPTLKSGQERRGVAARRMATRTQHVADQVVGLPGRAQFVVDAKLADHLGELVVAQVAIGERGHLLMDCVCVGSFHSPAYQRLPDWLSSKGLTLAEIASRARKIRDRTVPIGQFMTSAISS